MLPLAERPTAAELPPRPCATAPSAPVEDENPAPDPRGKREAGVAVAVHVAVAVRPRIPHRRRAPPRLLSSGALEPYVRVVRRVHSARIVDSRFRS